MIRTVAEWSVLAACLLGAGSVFLPWYDIPDAFLLVALGIWSNGFETWHGFAVLALFLAGLFAVVGSWRMPGRGWAGLGLVSALAVAGVLAAFLDWAEGPHYETHTSTWQWNGGPIQTRTEQKLIHFRIRIGVYIEFACAAGLLAWSIWKLSQQPASSSFAPQEVVIVE